MRSDGVHIALEQLSGVLSYLRTKLNLGSESNQPQVEELLALQHSLRYGAEKLDPVATVAPFISLLRSPALSGPFKLVALHALQGQHYLCRQRSPYQSCPTPSFVCACGSPSR